MAETGGNLADEVDRKPGTTNGNECTYLNDAICSCWMDSACAFPMIFIFGALEKCLLQRAEKDSVR